MQKFLTFSIFALFGLALVLLTLPPGFQVPGMQALGQVTMLLSAGLAFMNKEVRSAIGRPFYVVMGLLGMGLLFHVISVSYESAWDMLTPYRRYILVPGAAFIVGVYSTRLSFPWGTLCLLPVGVLNAVVSYLSFAHIPKSYIPELGGWIGGGSRITLNYLDNQTIVYSTTLLLTTAPLIIFGILALTDTAITARTFWGKFSLYFFRFMGTVAIAAYFVLGFVLGTRGGIAAFGGMVAVGAFLMLRRRPNTRAIAMVAFVGLVAAVAGALMALNLSGRIDIMEHAERFTGGQGTTDLTSGRLEIWRFRITEIISTPFGNGLDSGVDLIGFTGHNSYLDMAWLVGLPVALLLLCVTCWNSLRALIVILRGDASITLGCAIAVISLALYSMVESVYTSAYVVFVVFSFCIAMLSHKQGGPVVRSAQRIPSRPHPNAYAK
jgi:hypothetical protein